MFLQYLSSQSEEQRRIDKIHSDCKKDIEEGGFITILDRVEEEATEGKKGSTPSTEF